MYFQGGLIPSYILVKNLDMLNTIWALVLPPAVSAFNLIIMRNFFSSLPEEIEESARVDGASDFQILTRIVLPLSKSVLATVSLWCIVYHWNEWFNCMIYMQDDEKFVLQYVLRQILLQGQDMSADLTQVATVSSDSIKMATLVVAVLPILCVYPFVQKYFVKGVMIGAVKG